MAGLSPLNANLINNSSPNLLEKKPDKHERVFRNLIAESAVVKPNKAKAVLVKESFPQSVVSSVKDFINDGKNFFKATTTGKMDDNNLGRINDFGMKTGGLVIATFLASLAKTKTAAIMQFIGGGAFFASMSLWPKLFINLPAKLIHGFRIDQKYISAQNEKKDFFLDNQYLPWDAFSEDELRENAKKAGIDYDSENGDEKIKRKMQKTALQNRTLWMATAGFATPLMTALFGDWVEPKVKKSVIKNGFEKSKRAMDELDSVLDKAKPVVKNAQKIEDILYDFDSRMINDRTLYRRLSDALSIDMTETFNSLDDLSPVQDLKFNVSPEEIHALRLQKSEIINENLDELLKKEFMEFEDYRKLKHGKKMLDRSFAKKLDKSLGSTVTNIGTSKVLDENTIDEICKEFKASKTKTTEDLVNIIAKRLGNSEEMKISITKKVTKMKLKYDDTAFFDTIRRYNNETLAAVRGRLKEYLNILNPVIGSREESVYTEMYKDAMKRVLPKKSVKFRGPIYDKETLGMLGMLKNGKKYTHKDQYGNITVVESPSEAMRHVFEKYASMTGEKYKAVMKKIYTPKSDDVVEFNEAIKAKDNVQKITAKAKEFEYDDTPLQKANLELENWLAKNIKSFAELSEYNNDAIRAKSLICANVEKRIFNGDFEADLKKLNMISDETPLKYWADRARYMLYEGTVASDACRHEIENEKLYINLRNIVFNKEKFAEESEVMKNIDSIVEGIANLKTSKKDGVLVTGLANLEKTMATEILNNQAWKKVFIPMSLVLVAVTLLVQPFFGNIKKEFPDENKGGKE